MAIPASVLAIFGALCGALLKQTGSSHYKKCLWIFIAGLVFLGIGWLWNLGFPVNKKLWTSSFILVAAGWSLLHLTFFYLIVDIWGIRRLLFPFVLIGMNPLLIYFVSEKLVDFSSISTFFSGSLTSFIGGPLGTVIHCLIMLAIEVLFLYYLYLHKVFFRV